MLEAMTIEEMKTLTQELGVLSTQFKDANDKREAEEKEQGEAQAETRQQLDKLNDLVAKSEEKLQEHFDAVSDTQKRLEELELARQRPGYDGKMSTEERGELRRNSMRFIAKSICFESGGSGIPDITTAEKEAYATVKEEVEREFKALSVGTDTAGGFLVPPDYRNEMLRNITEATPARQVSRVITTSRDRVQIPSRTGVFAAVRAGELSTRSETTGLVFGLKEIPAGEMYALVDVSFMMLEDAAFDIEQEIMTVASEQFAVKEGTEFISGVGIDGSMEGITIAAGVTSQNSGHATQITADGLIGLFYALPEPYARNSTWLARRATWGVIRKLKDGEGNYLWAPGLDGQPSTMLGSPMVSAPDMVAPTSGVTYTASTKPMAFGDFRKAYTMVDRLQMNVIRDNLTQATSGLFRLFIRRRVGGQVVLPEAFQLLNISA